MTRCINRWTPWVTTAGSLRRCCTSRQGAFGDAMLLQRSGENGGGGDRVGNREIDPDTADRGHGVRGVSDAEQPRFVPPTQTVDPHVEDFDVVPRCEGVDRGFGDQFGDLGTEGVQSTIVQLLLAAFGQEAPVWK